MRLELTGRHVDITPALRRLVEIKLARLERLLPASALSAQVVLTRERHDRRADLTLHTRGEKFLHGAGRSSRWDAAMGEAVDKIKQQAKKVKGKWQERKRHLKEPPGPGAGERPPAPPPVAVRMPRILRSTRTALKPMSVADAAREAEASRDGIIVFRNEETAAVAVVVRRPTGELTLIETEA
jgi:putative sigma-54 modulation protein